MSEHRIPEDDREDEPPDPLQQGDEERDGEDESPLPDPGATPS
jgi:hypothetical protein